MKSKNLGKAEKMNKRLLAVFPIVVAIVALAYPAFTLINAQPGIAGEVYTIDNAAGGNHVLEFNRAPDGSLTSSGTFSANGTGTGTALQSQGALALSRDGRWLFVVDAGSNQISVFQINGTTLTLTDTVSSHGTTPISLTVFNNWVYVLDNGTSLTHSNIAGFTLGLNGTLTYVAGSAQPLSGMPNSSPEQIGFNPTGNILVVTEKAANITDTYTVNGSGVASAPIINPSLSPGPYGFAFSYQGVLVLSEAGTNTLSSFAVMNNGSLITLSGSMPDFGNAPCWVAISSNGQFAYTSNAHGGTISGYTISATGTINLFSSIAAKTNIPTLDLAFSKDNKFLYALNGNSITGFQVFSGGALWQVSSVNGLPASTTGLAAT